MLSFLRRVLCRDDEQNTGRSNSEIHCHETPSQSNNYQVIPNYYGTFSRTILFLPNPLSTQTAARIHSPNYSTSFNFPQKPNIPSVYNQPKQIIRRHDVQLFSGVDPKRTPDIPTATHPLSPKSGSSFSSPFDTINTKPLLASALSTSTSNQTNSEYNVVEKGSNPQNVIPKDIKGLIGKDMMPGVLRKPLSSQTYKDYFAALYYLEAWHHARCYTGSSIIAEACKYSEQQTGVSVVPHNSSSKADTSQQHLLQSTSKGYLKRKIKLVSNQKLKIVQTESSLGKTSQKGNDYPQTSRNSSRTLPTKDVKVDIDKSPKQSTVPAKRSLADYLRESGPRLVSLYGSTELYPTDEARCIIQGMVRTILNLKNNEKKHNYLRHPENLILGDKECHPYSNYVRDLATEHVIRNRKILEQAGQDFSSSTEVTLEKNIMDLKSDDLSALKYLIFVVILVLDDDKKPPLPAEWRSFKKLFSNTKLDYAVLSSHPCLWGYRKRLGFYFALDRWRNPFKSEKVVRDMVDENLSCMRIFKTKWLKRFKRDSHLVKFAGKMTRSRQRKVYGLIRFFRNLVEHCSDAASASSPYKKERYLDYKLRDIFPNLLEELYQRLLLAGFNY